MLFLLDNGHGGIINNEYQTKGKRSPVWDDGSQLFEGEFNRAIVNRLAERMTTAKIPYVLISPEQRDITLPARVARANRYDFRTSLFISIHSNAGGGSGSEFYTSIGQTSSDVYADIFSFWYKSIFPGQVLRTDMSDGDTDKEQDFYVLRNTHCPAILTESFFMDNEQECKEILLTWAGRERVADFHFMAIQEIHRRADINQHHINN